MKLLSLTLLFVSAVLNLNGQLAEPQPSVPPLPPGPLIQKRAPSFAQWIIRSKPIKGGLGQENKVADANAKSSEAKEKPSWGSLVSITKTGEIMLRQTMDDQSRVWNTWCTRQLQTTVYPDGKQAILQAGNSDATAPTANFEDYSQSDFPGFEWITQKEYVGQKEYQGKKCIVYQNVPPTDGSDHSKRTALVDLETRFPVALLIDNDTHTYEFKAPPQGMLTLPPFVQGLIDSRQRMMSSATRKAPKL